MGTIVGTLIIVSGNEVKYETLIIGLKLAKVVGTIVVAIQNGSQMVVKQVKSAL